VSDEYFIMKQVINLFCHFGKAGGAGHHTVGNTRHGCYIGRNGLAGVNKCAVTAGYRLPVGKLNGYLSYSVGGSIAARGFYIYYCIQAVSQ